MNVVLDTNTVISGLFRKGAPRQVLDLARSAVITLYTSPPSSTGRTIDS